VYEPEAKGYGNKGEYMGELLTPTHLMVIAVVVFLVFGGKKLPELGKGLGEGLRGFKDAIKGLTDDIDGPGKPAPTIVPTPNESLR
jgi:sec-independent protein translocase protein TatA